MKRICCFRVVMTLRLLILSCVAFSQNKPTEEDFISILSGNIATYKKLNIKTVTLLQNEATLNEIIYKPNKNILLINNNLGEITYLLNNKSKPKHVIFPKRKHIISYDALNNEIELHQIEFDYDSLVKTQSIRFPTINNSKMELFELEKKRKITNEVILYQSAKRVINQRDSLWSYDEITINKDIERIYFNKTKSKFKFKTDLEYVYDSIYVYPNGALYSLHDSREGDYFIRTIVKNDSLFEYFSKNDKKYRLMISKGNNLVKDYTYQEGTDLELETTDYSYFPLNGFDNVILWKVTKYNHLSNTETIAFPNKKNYKLKNNQIFEKRKLQKIPHYENCNMTSVHNIKQRQKSILYRYDIASTSILVDLKKVYRNLNYETDMYLQDHNIHQTYIHSEVPIDNFSKAIFTGIYKTGTIPNEIKKDVLELVKYIDEKRNNINDYKVEITTYNNEKWTINPALLFKKINYTIDWFIFDDDVQLKM